MNTQQAIELLTSLVEQNMSNGAIKNFVVLDKLREAISILNASFKTNSTKAVAFLFWINANKYAQDEKDFSLLYDANGKSYTIEELFVMFENQSN